MRKKAKCKARRADGQKCAAFAAQGSEFCLWHDPAKRQVVVEAGRTGGSRGRLAVLPADGPDLPCTSPQEALQAVQVLISAVAKGQVDPRVANAAGTLLNVWKALYEMAKAAAPGEDEKAEIENQLEFAEVIYGLASEGETILDLAEKIEGDAVAWFQEQNLPLPERYQRAADLREERAAIEEAATLAAMGQVATETR